MEGGGGKEEKKRREKKIVNRCKASLTHTTVLMTINGTGSCHRVATRLTGVTLLMITFFFYQTESCAALVDATDFTVTVLSPVSITGYRNTFILNQ